MRFLPPAILDDALKRYSSVGVRLHTLYRLFHGTTYFDDLRHLGFGHVAVLLAEIHKKGNEFVHGNPRALNDKTVQDLVENLKDEHESWIAIYNFRLNYKRGTAEFAVPFPI